jgi:hypothetical protein
MTNDDLWELFTERAALREYDGGATRNHAENRAMIDLRKLTGELPPWLVEKVMEGQREARDQD